MAAFAPLYGRRGRLFAALLAGLAFAGWAAIEAAGALRGFTTTGAALDLLFPLRHAIFGSIYAAAESPVAVVVIDEETYGTEPFAGLPQVAWTPQLGRLLEALDAAGAKLIGLDLVYPTTLETLLPGYDRPLRRAVAKLGRAGKLVMGRVDSSREPILPERGQLLAVGDEAHVRSLQLATDADGVARRHPGTLPDAQSGVGVPTLVGELAGRAGARAPKTFFINYNTGQDTLPVYGFADVLACAEAENAGFLAKAFDGRIVLVGTALDVEDRRVPATRFALSPYDGPTTRCVQRPAEAPVYGDAVTRHTLPGVFIHAAALNTLLLQRPLEPLSPLLSGAVAFGFVGLVTLGFQWLHPGASLVLLAGALLLALFGSVVALDGGHLLPLPVLAAGAVVSAGTSYALRVVEEMKARRRSEAAKRELTQRFGRYLAPVLIERLESDAEALDLGGEARRLTIFFSDIVGYTSVSEKLRHDPHRLVEVINGYFTAMVEIVERDGGYVDKFIGDCVMAIWGAPLDEPQQELKAVNAAFDCLQRLERFNQEVVVGQHGLPPLGIRIGINTGVAIVGNMGSPTRLNYTVTGDTVNLASRLEGANRAYGTTIMIGPETAVAVRDHFVLRQLDFLTVKGKAQAVEVFEVVGRAGEVPQGKIDRIAEFEAALGRYRARDFDGAAAIFATLAGDDPVAELYLARCRHFKATPPPVDWNGSFELHEK